MSMMAGVGSLEGQGGMFDKERVSIAGWCGGVIVEKADVADDGLEKQLVRMGCVKGLTVYRIGCMVVCAGGLGNIMYLIYESYSGLLTILYRYGCSHHVDLISPKFSYVFL